MALLALVPLGGFYLQSRDAAAPTIAENLQPFANGDDPVDVTACVIREGLVRDSPYGGNQESVDVTAERLQLGDHVSECAVGIRLTIYSKQTEEDEARDEGTGSPLLRVHLRPTSAFHREAADAAQLSQSRRDGYGRLSGVTRHSPDRFFAGQQRGSTAGIRGQPHRFVEERRASQRAGAHPAALAR